MTLAQAPGAVAEERGHPLLDEAEQERGAEELRDVHGRDGRSDETGEDVREQRDAGEAEQLLHSMHEFGIPLDIDKGLTAPFNCPLVGVEY